MCSKTSRIPEGKEPHSQVDKDSGVEQFYVRIIMLWAYPKSEKAPNQTQVDVREEHSKSTKSQLYYILDSRDVCVSYII